MSDPTIDNYWLNEIESLEETGRQIIIISVALLGLSITMLATNFGQIFNLSRQVQAVTYPSTTYQYSINNNASILYILDRGLYYLSVYWSYNISITLIFLLSFSFLFVWVFAIYTAKKALNLEPILTGNDLEGIAGRKHDYISDALEIIIWGMVSIASLFFFFNTLPNISLSKEISILIISLIAAAGLAVFWGYSVYRMFNALVIIND